MRLLGPAILLGAAILGCQGVSEDTPSGSRPVVTDPVCGEVVEPSTPWKAVFRDNVYYFHSDGCRGRFAANPDYYAFGPFPDRGPRVYRQMALYTDPVCGRETTATAWWSEYRGRLYYFHDNECLLEFRFRPQAYVMPEHRLEAK
jgi:YHS domain-containing protein